MNGSASNTAHGGDALAFTLHYWQPDPRLRGLVSGYHRYALDPGPGRRHADVFYPAWANIRLQTSGTPWSMRIGARDYPALPPAAAFGPTSRASFCESATGSLVGIGLTPLGWTRMTRMPADKIADRVLPLADVLGSDADVLHAAIADAGDDEIAPVLDAFLVRRLLTPRRQDAAVAAIHRYLLAPHPVGVADAIERLGLPQWTLNRLSRSAFGFTTKLLLRRTRFLRSLMLLRDTGDQPWAARIGSDYYDCSHFVRDAHEFLGMSPRDFLALPKPMNDASTRLRAEILGAPAQALDTRSADWHGVAA